MTTDFRALCAELAEKLDEFDRLLHGAQYVEHPLTYRARAALAEPQTEPPTAEEVTELVVWLRRSAGCADESSKDLRAADLLERQQPLTPQPPTDKELLHEWDLVPGARAYEEDVVGFARAVLARWGNA